MTLRAVPALRYVNDGEPGWRRVRRGRGFQYVDSRGRPVRDERAIARVKALAIPPAWTDVWISPDPAGHIAATGRDSRGRKQYRYHDEWREFRDQVKFDRMLPFGGALPDIRRRIEHDLRLGGLPRDKVLALVARLLETTLVRVGNEEYARENGAFGLTTLRHRHVRVTPREARFRFVGKGGQTHEVVADDPRLARAIARCEELPGQRLFQYVADDGATHAINSQDVNDYLRAAAGIDVTAKDFRTWMATRHTATDLGSVPVPEGERARAQTIRDAVCRTASALGNTPTVCRTSYVHPVVLAAFESGELAERWARPAGRTPRRLVADERRLLALLRDETPSARRRVAESAVALDAA